MAELSTVTIGLTLLGFIVGAVIVALANQSRMKRLEEAHGAQLRHLRDEEAKCTALLESAQESQARAESDARDALREVESVQREMELLRAQQSEELEAAIGLEDRLNAAEARLLTIEAIVPEQEEELLRWHRAYGALKGVHAQLIAEHQAVTTRTAQLDGDLVARRQELDALHSRLDSLQNALSVAIQNGASGELLPLPAGELPAGVEAIALAKAEVQALLRQREVELGDLRSRLSATRFSVNVLARSGAELAALLNQSDDERSADATEALFLRAGHLYQPETEPDAASESLATLEGIISDWYGEVKPVLPWSNALLSRFAGESVGVRFARGKRAAADELGDELDAAEWSIGEWEEGADDVRPTGSITLLPTHDALPPELMLATVKAATSSALQRSLKRQYELERDAARVEQELARVQEGESAWRDLLTQIAADDDDVAALLPENDDAALPEPAAVIALLRSKLGAKNHTTAQLADEGGAVASAPALDQPSTQRPPQPPAPAQDKGAARRTLVGWLRRIDQAVQRNSRRGE